MKFYLFHVENPEEIQNGKKPIVTEKGPYAYKQIREKRNLKRYKDEIDYGMNVIYR